MLYHNYSYLSHVTGFTITWHEKNVDKIMIKQILTSYICAIVNHAASQEPQWYYPDSASEVLCHNPPLPGLPDHVLPKRSNRSQYNTINTNKDLVHSVIQSLLYDSITSLVNCLPLVGAINLPKLCVICCRVII